MTITPEQVWDLRSASGSLSETGGESGWSLSPDAVQRFFLPSRKAKNEDTEAPRRTRQILLVEDSSADAGLVREALAEYDIECWLVLITNGEDAIEFFARLETDQSGCPDLVVLDLNLPRRSGRDVLRSIRAGVRCNRIPVVVLSSSNTQRDRDDTARLGASKYLLKPSRLAEFMQLGLEFKRILDGA